MLIDGLSSIGANLSIPIEKITLSQEKKEDTGFAGILEEQLKEQDIKLELYQWYKLGTYSGQPVHIRLFPEGVYSDQPVGGEISNGGETSDWPAMPTSADFFGNPGSLAFREMSEVRDRIRNSFSAEDHRAISKDEGIIGALFTTLNSSSDLPVSRLHEEMGWAGYTISDVQNLLSQIEVSDGPSTYRPLTVNQTVNQISLSYRFSTVDQIDDPYPFQPGDLIKALMEARFPKEPLKEEIEDEDKVQKEEGKERIERQVAAFLYEQNMILSTST